MFVPGDKEDYLLVKSFKKNIHKNGKGEPNYGPLYVHFHNECLKEYTNLVHQVQYDNFPYKLIKIDKRHSQTFPEDILANLVT